MTESGKTTDDVTRELNELLEANNMTLDVSAVLKSSGVMFVVKVMHKPEVPSATPDILG